VQPIDHRAAPARVLVCAALRGSRSRELTRSLLPFDKLASLLVAAIT